MFIPKGINNTVVVESLRRYGNITEWEARHSCEHNYIKILTMENTLSGVPIFCPYCENQIVMFEELYIVDEAGPVDYDWYGSYNKRSENKLNDFYKKMNNQKRKIR